MPASTEAWGTRLLRWWGTTYGCLVVAYLFLDRFAAYTRIPHTTVYIGEITLVFGVVALAVATPWARRALRWDPLIAALLAYMGWGLVRMLPDLHVYGVTETVRDSALWYYGLFAILFVTAATAVPDLPRRFLQGFSKVVPWLTLWLPVALLLVRANVKGPRFRLYSVGLFNHKPGNICVAAAICFAWLWLVPDERRRPITRGLLSAVSLFTIVLGLTQTRGGGLAAITGVVLCLLFMGRRRSRLIATIVGVSTLVLALGAVSGITYHTHKTRTISVSQLVQNFESISGGQSNANLTSTVNFREMLWHNILHDQVSTSHLFNGLGYGVNLAMIGGLETHTKSVQAQQLRSAHNSLLDILARGGLIGAFLFVLAWIGWFWRMTSARRRSQARGHDTTAGVIAVCMIGCVAILINCFFDPTLEGAQVAALFYGLFAMGVIAARRPIESEPASTAPAAIPPLAAAGAEGDVRV